jgi:hypothetical protein
MNLGRWLLAAGIVLAAWAWIAKAGDEVAAGETARKAEIETGISFELDVPSLDEIRPMVRRRLVSSDTSTGAGDGSSHRRRP